MRVWKNAEPTLRHVLERSRKRADATFLVYEDERITFEQHYRAVARLAGILISDFGVEKGDRVAIAAYLGTTPETLSRRLAALSASGVIELHGRRDVTILDIDALEHVATPR